MWAQMIKTIKYMKLAKIVGESISKPYKIEWYGEPDTRSYYVDFKKINNKLNFKTNYDPAYGAWEIYKALEERRIQETPETKVIQWWRTISNKG